MSTLEAQEPIASERVQFRLAGRRNPLILVPVHVNDKGPYEFILDTGASHCLLSQKLADGLGVRPESEKQATGAGGGVKLVLGHVESMAVGSVRKQNVPIGITTELERIAAVIRSEVDGDLGFEFLKDFALTIDYRDSALYFVSSLGPEKGSRSANSAPFMLAAPDQPLILVEVSLNSQGPYQFALDTGASRTIVSTEIAEKLGIETIGDNPATGAGGRVKIMAGKVDSLAIGDAIVHDHDIGVGEFLAMLSTAVGTKMDGIVGYNFLNRFRVTIDYFRSVLELAPAAE
jgi:predicted aspartyl protease